MKNSAKGYWYTVWEISNAVSRYMVPVFCAIGMIASASMGEDGMGEGWLGVFIYLLIGAIFSTVVLIMFKKGKISKNTMESSMGMGCAYLILCFFTVWPAIPASFLVAMPLAYYSRSRYQRQQQIEQLEAEKAKIIAMIDEALEEAKEH